MGSLARRDLVRVTGPDTWTFLQNLLSQDVENLADGDSLPTLLLTPQGKVDVVGVITRVGDDAVIATDPGWGERLVASLARFKIRTMVWRGDQASVQAGAGVVADSDAELEDLECHNKAKALLTAAQASRNLHSVIS